MTIETANYLRELSEFLRGHGFSLAAQELEDIVGDEVLKARLQNAVGLGE